MFGSQIPEQDGKCRPKNGHNTHVGDQRPELLGEDQLVAMRESQPIKTARMLNHDFALLAEQLLGSQTRHAELARLEFARLRTLSGRCRVH
jgi:hypothetical protein